MNQNNYREIYDLLDKLCHHLISPKHKEAFKIATQFIANSRNALCLTHVGDESLVLASISNHLAATKSHSDVILFMSLHEQLSTFTELQHRNSILSFLLAMSKGTNDTLMPLQFESLGSSSSSSAEHILLANPYGATAYRQSLKCETTNLERLVPSLSLKPSIRSSLSTSSMDTNLRINRQINRHVSLPAKSASAKNIGSRDISMSTTSSASAASASMGDISDELVQDILYAFTGVQGKYLRKDVISGGFKLDPKARNLTAWQAGMLLRLAELGYYHDQLRSYADTKSGRSPIGLMGQGFISKLNNELTQYYGMVAILQEQLNRSRQAEITDWENNHSDNKLSLLMVMVWAAEPLYRLQWLTTIADSCQEKKGGILASAIYSYQSHGDPTVQALVRELLLSVCNPLRFMLSRWLLDGEIDDPFSEFFIEILPEVATDRLWHDKYRVREALLPNFISKELANKILVTGKSINFLREVCQDKTPTKDRDELKNCFESNVENLFSPVSDTKLHETIDTVYLNTSKKVLDIVMGPHRLLEHLQAMRRYLLLGQGDFIGLLMENLKSELDRPAKELHCYDLSAIMDSSIRLTNVQFEDPEILRHLAVRLMNPFNGDLGWDIFSLQYTVHGPLSTMLEPSMCKYQVIFKFLWHTKHIEFVLSSKIWKDQICNSKLLRSMKKEISKIAYRLHLYTSEMIHFIHQIEYYILFEVIECSWTNFMRRVNQAHTLDDILEAHNEFLEMVKAGIFLDEKSITLCGNLENVHRAIMKLEPWQDKFYRICIHEKECRDKYDADIAASEVTGTFGVTNEKRFERDQELKLFEIELLAVQKTLDAIGYEYEMAVRQFLLMLTCTNDLQLQVFATRLDFNEYYKKRDQRLEQQLTFEHMRTSNISFVNRMSSSWYSNQCN